MNVKSQHLLIIFTLVFIALVAAVPAMAQQPVITTGSTTLGDVVTAANGMTLYIFTNDEPGVSNCNGDCAAAWPPLTVAAATEAIADSTIGGTIGTIQRQDGTLQVTLNGQPLYFFASDTAPGDVTGQGAGDVWFVVPAAEVAPAEQVTEAEAAAPAQADVVPANEFVAAANSDELGLFLTAANGMTLYTFTNDEPGVSNCVGQCLDLWPRFAVDDSLPIPETVPGIPGTFSAIPLEDGLFHMTYNDLPLYFYSEDAAPGDVNGQGVGNVWFVVPLSVFRVEANEALGSLLTGSNGMTLYTFSNDEPGVSNCVGQCLELWPAYVFDSADAVPAEITGLPGTFSTVEREPGVFQAAFNDQPLYFFSEDAQPGDVNGQGVGDVWFVVALDTVRVADSSLGTILTTSSGFTLYTFANDEPGWSNCVGGCADSWPPLTVAAEGAVYAPAGLEDAFATSLRADGSFHVTFNDQPLYTYVQDAAPGDVNGQGVGEVWFAATVDAPAAGASDGAAAETTTIAQCNLDVSRAVNVRQGPGTEFDVAWQAGAYTSLTATAQTNGADGFVWYQVGDGVWVREDVVNAAADCSNLTVVEA